MSTLTRTEIEARLKSSHPDRLTVTPMLSPKQIGDISIDLRIGNQFIVFRQHTRVLIDLLDSSGAEFRRLQERRIVQFGQRFVVHPGVLALGATFEYIQLPSDLEGQVEGRSSWARLGLQIATATCIEPGFSGVVTLELSNVGNMPLELVPGMRIGQLILRETVSRLPNAYGTYRKYKCPIGPQFSRLHSDADAKVFRR